MSEYNNILRITLLTILGALFLSSSYAQSQWKFQLNNEINLLSRSYLSNINDLYYGHQGELQSFHELKVAKGSRIKFYAQGRLNGNVAHKDRTRLLLNEAHLSLRKGSATIKLGKQTVKWGSISGMSTLDMINRYDYYDYIDTDNELLGLWGGKLNVSTGPFNWTVMVMESSNSSRFHISDNRWVRLPQSTSLPQMPGTEFPLRLNEVTLADSDRPLQLGAEMDFEIGKLTTKLSWYKGSNDAPQRSLAILGFQEEHVGYNIELQYHDLMVSAMSLSTYLGTWNLWSELAQVNNKRINPEGALEDDNFTNLTIGTDRVFDFEDPEKQFRLVFQYFVTLNNPLVPYGAGDLDHVFQHALISDIQYRSSYLLSFGLRSAIEMRNFGVYFQPRIEFRASDKLLFHISGDILEGASDSFFGNYSYNSRLSLCMKYYM